MDPSRFMRVLKKKKKKEKRKEERKRDLIKYKSCHLLGMNNTVYKNFSVFSQP